MRLLLAQGYEFITLEEGVNLLKRSRPLDRKVTLTFDDGFRNVVQRAYPVMKRLKLKGCLFVVAGLAGTDQLLWTDMIDVVCRWRAGQALELEFPDGRARFHLDSNDAVSKAITAIKRRFRSLPDSQRRQYLRQIEAHFAEIDPCFVPDDFHMAGLDELKALDPAVLEVGNHTMSHPQLTQVTDSRLLRWEIREAKEQLGSLLGRRVEHFCYPAGASTPEVVRQVDEAGHLSAVTVNYGVNGTCADPLRLKRLGLPRDISQFQCRLSGLEGPLLRVKSLVHQVPARCVSGSGSHETDDHRA